MFNAGRTCFFFLLAYHNAICADCILTLWIILGYKLAHLFLSYSSCSSVLFYPSPNSRSQSRGCGLLPNPMASMTVTKSYNGPSPSGQLCGTSEGNRRFLHSNLQQQSPSLKSRSNHHCSWERYSWELDYNVELDMHFLPVACSRCPRTCTLYRCKQSRQYRRRMFGRARASGSLTVLHSYYSRLDFKLLSWALFSDGLFVSLLSAILA
ncbi:hypothetical protein BJY04DRAFT_202042 [Aspergillus karnatakaensis]|uniref:uncharacterized protein n=1 Tax=Aspergillus karnatakaensis TaxID=1810916 RepID=UPI003CCCC475